MAPKFRDAQMVDQGVHASSNNHSYHTNLPTLLQTCH